MNPIVYLPLEMKSREFASKALLAAELAARGVPVVIGQQWLIYQNLHLLPAGVVLFKSFNQIHLQAMQVARKAGHKVLAHEEENLGIVDTQVLLDSVPPDLANITHALISHGEFEQQILSKLLDGKIKIHALGNGRMDVLKPAFRGLYTPEVDALKQRYGDFVLVNTNYGIIHNVWGDLDNVKAVFAKAGAYKADDPRSVAEFDERVIWEQENFTAVVRLVRELASARPSLKIIIRPHPAENLKHWNDAFAGLTNVLIIREGAHVPWTLAARMLLHTSCTTGLEAQIAGQYAVSFVPLESRMNTLFVSNHLNPLVHDHAAALAAISAYLDNGERLASQPASLADQYLANLGAINATTRIANLLMSMLPASGNVQLPALKPYDRAPQLKEKFTLQTDELVATVQRLTAGAGIKGDFQLQPMGDSLFLLSASNVTRQQTASDDVNQSIPAAFKAGNWPAVTDLFKAGFGTAHRYPKLCYLAGVAWGKQGNIALALQYLQNAALNGVVDHEVSSALADAYLRSGNADMAARYAKQAYEIVPTHPGYFAQWVEAAKAAGLANLPKWVVIGDSHVRYFRYMQANRPRFFGDAVHLECHEFGGATAYGLKNTGSQSGALQATQKLASSLGDAAQVLIYFGEVDCRRAAWKAAAVAGKTIEQALDEAAGHLEAYLIAHVLPNNQRVTLLGAKPQIIQDDDFYKNSLEDERIVFKPLPERQAATRYYNGLLQNIAARLGIGYVDIDHVLKDDASSAAFYQNAFWHDYSDDTHGNLDYFASLYHERLQTLVTS